MKVTFNRHNNLVITRSMIEQNIIINYAHIYRSLLSSLLKENVGMDMRMFPWAQGVVFIVRIGYNEKNNEEIRAMADDFRDVQRRAGLQGVDLTRLDSTSSKYLFNKNKIALIKPEMSGWDKNAAAKDVNSLLSIIKRGEQNG